MENYNCYFQLLIEKSVQIESLINPHKPNVLFVGHSQTVQTLARCSILWHLIRVSTVCFWNGLLKFEKKRNTSQHPIKQIWTVPIDNAGIFHSA